MWDDLFGDTHQEPTSQIDMAQICLNGHVINASFEKYPIHNKKHCPDCGEVTITNCPSCQAKIPGEIHYSNVMGSSNFEVPSFCVECGKPYPWTSSRLKAAKELAAEIEELNKEDHTILEKSIDEIAVNNPQASVGATRIKKILTKVSGAAGEILQKTIIEVASETAKRILLGH